MFARELGFDVDCPEGRAQAHAVGEEIGTDGGDKYVGFVATGRGCCGGVKEC